MRHVIFSRKDFQQAFCPRCKKEPAARAVAFCMGPALAIRSDMPRVFARDSGNDMVVELLNPPMHVIPFAGDLTHITRRQRSGRHKILLLGG